MPLSTSFNDGEDYRREQRRSSHDEAALEGLAVAGLVAVLRQLGDVAEFAADVFQDLQQQLTAASARARRLAARAKQLDDHGDEFLLCSCRHCCQRETRRCLQVQPAAAAAASSNAQGGRVGCHEDHLNVNHGVVAGADMPRLIVDYIKRCRGPPRLSLLDRFDAAGEGACLKRYTDPSFFRVNSADHQQRTKETTPKFQTRENSEPPEPAHTDCKSQTDASSDGSLSMLRPLKHQQPTGSVFPNLTPEIQQQDIQKHEYSAEGRASSATRPSEIDVSFTSSPDLDMEMEKGRANHQGTGQPKELPTPYCLDAGSDYGGNFSELERTSSFEAWLPTDARFNFEDEIAKESSSSHGHGTSNQNVSYAATSSSYGALSSTLDLEAKQNSDSAEISCKKGVSNCKRSKSKYKGRVELIASRVSNLPRKLFMKEQHDPLTGSLQNMPPDAAAPTGTDSLPSNGLTGIGDSITGCNRNPEAIAREALLPILVSDPVFRTQDSVPHQSTRLSQSVDAEIHHQQQDGASISNPRCSSTSPENCGEPASATDSENLFLQRTGCMIDGSLHIKPTSVSSENSCSEAIKVDTPALPPIPPTQWLSVKVDAGHVTHRKTFRKNPVQSAECKILKKTPEPSEHEVDSDEDCPEPSGTNQNLKPGAETLLEQELLLLEQELLGQQFASGDSESSIQVADSPTEISGAPGNAVSISEVNKRSENVFFSAVQELANMPPPSIPRPKHSLATPERITLRNGPSPIHPSRNILDSSSIVLEQIKSSYSPKPSFSGMSSTVMASPRSSRVPTTWQRAHDIRQADADEDDDDSEDSWSHSDRFF